jgi:hypothetical protein
MTGRSRQDIEAERRVAAFWEPVRRERAARNGRAKRARETGTRGGRAHRMRAARGAAR